MIRIMDYISLRQREFQTTLSVLQALPADKLHLRPADKSRTAAELATVLAGEERAIKSLLETGVSNANAPKMEVLPTMADIISAWQQAVATNDAIIGKLSASDFAKPVNFYGMNIPLVDALWLELLDHIHHRGQFSVYLRIAGGKVPPIYGPTADVPFPMG
jgi:uncharacterized damage-inducible protein DinB